MFDDISDKEFYDFGKKFTKTEIENDIKELE